MNPEDVAEWLKDHPDFFIRHPELISRLEFSHDTGAASLLEHQAVRLRDENARLKDQLRQLAGIAGQNERLMQRLHDLTLELSTSASPEELVNTLAGHLQRSFQADTVMLWLTDPAPELSGLDPVRTLPAQLPDWLTELHGKDQPLCGRLTREKAGFVFEDRTDTVASAALVPLKSGGLLCIGSSREDRFYPGMGTLFLELLGTTINNRLAWLEESRRKSA